MSAPSYLFLVGNFSGTSAVTSSACAQQIQFCFSILIQQESLESISLKLREQWDTTANSTVIKGRSTTFIELKQIYIYKMLLLYIFCKFTQSPDYYDDYYFQSPKTALQAPITLLEW